MSFTNNETKVNVRDEDVAENTGELETRIVQLKGRLEKVYKCLHKEREDRQAVLKALPCVTKALNSASLNLKVAVSQRCRLATELKNVEESIVQLVTAVKELAQDTDEERNFGAQIERNLHGAADVESKLQHVITWVDGVMRSRKATYQTDLTHHKSECNKYVLREGYALWGKQLAEEDRARFKRERDEALADAARVKEERDQALAELARVKEERDQALAKSKDLDECLEKVEHDRQDIDELAGQLAGKRQRPH